MSVWMILGSCTSCTSLPRSGFDPSGERLFDSCPISASNCTLFGGNKMPTATTGTSTVPTPSWMTPPLNSVTTPGTTTGANAIPLQNPPQIATSSTALPGSLGAMQPGTGTTAVSSSTATILGSNARGVNTALVTSPDSGPSPVFQETGGYALPTQPISGPALIVTPREQLAPVGSEVVLIASYLGSGDRLITNEKVEWNLEGVGGIQNFDPGACCDPLFLDFVKSKKITDRYAVTKTSQKYQTIDRGTPETADDIHILRGQTWISVNSMKEGTTHVTAFAPGQKDWSRRSDVGLIHWIDAQWILPRPAIAPVGETRMLTTSVLRQTDGAPRPGWIVRYELLNGPPAGFGPSFAQIEEVVTDQSGQASVQLSQKTPQSGTNTITIRIIRPAKIEGDGSRVTVGNETIRQSWSGNPGLRIQMSGPQNASLGQDLPYTMTLINSTSRHITGTVSLPISPLTTYISSSPNANKQGTTLYWNVEVPPSANAVIKFTLQQATSGALNLAPQFHEGTIPNSSPYSVTTGGTTPRIGGADPASISPTLPSIPGGSGTPNSATIFNANGSANPNLGSVNLGGSNPGGINLGGHSTESNLSLNVGQSIGTTSQIGGICDVTFSVTNRGNNPLQDVQLQLNLPSEYTDRTKEGIEAIRSDGLLDTTSLQNINRSFPVIQPGQTVSLRAQIPKTPPGGYQFIGKVFVGGRLLEQTTMQRISPR
ncbi:MAG: hypothetical protein ACRCUY_02945 [Thermoguttaceae bacterium]